MRNNSRPRGWSSRLTRPIILKDATQLRTLGDAASYMLALPKHYGERNSWKRAIELLMDAAENGGSCMLND